MLMQLQLKDLFNNDTLHSPVDTEAGQLPPSISSLRYDISLQHAVSCKPPNRILDPLFA